MLLTKLFSLKTTLKLTLKFQNKVKKKIYLVNSMTMILLTEATKKTVVIIGVKNS